MAFSKWSDQPFFDNSILSSISSSTGASADNEHLQLPSRQPLGSNTVWRSVTGLCSSLIRCEAWTGDPKSVPKKVANRKSSEISGLPLSN